MDGYHKRDCHSTPSQESKKGASGFRYYHTEKNPPRFQKIHGFTGNHSSPKTAYNNWWEIGVNTMGSVFTGPLYVSDYGDRRSPYSDLRPTMASLILLLSEIFKPENPDLLLAGNCFAASSRSVASLKGRQIAGLSSLVERKPPRRSPDDDSGADGVAEDPSEMKVSIDMIWS